MYRTKAHGGTKWADILRAGKTLPSVIMKELGLLFSDFLF
jgi:hypothetical protein